MNSFSYIVLVLIVGVLLFFTTQATSDGNIPSQVNNFSFNTDQEYLEDKLELLNTFQKAEKTQEGFTELINDCYNFGRKYYGPNYKEACNMQARYFFYFQNEKEMIVNILQEESLFYENYAGTTVKIAFGGDIMLSRGVGSRNKELGYDRVFKNFHPNDQITNDTILFYNLESPFTKKTDADIDQKTFIFKTNPKSVQVLNELQRNNDMVLSLANNHIRNAGGEGIDSSIDILKNNNIIPVGAERGEVASFVSLEKNSKKLCFGAYTYDGRKSIMRDFDGARQNYYVNPINEKAILSDIENMINENCDLKIISLHWGTEYKTEPNNQQKKLAHNFIDAGADLILGGHSHILGKIEEYKGKKIYYSLGNYIFDQNWGQTVAGGSFDREYDPIYDSDTIPTYIGNTFIHEYFFPHNGTNKLYATKNIKHRIDFGAIYSY